MAPQQTIGRYEIFEELGHGAMGNVYRAKDPAMDRVVALKTIRADVLIGQQKDQFRERFYREARAAGALSHPGIVPVFDVGEHNGQPFLVMEFVKGRTLADLAKAGERLPVERICEIGQQVAEALDYAHNNGVVHRDIKTANILLTSREAYGIERPKITDFGVAKLASMQITTTGQMLGTPAFMPPEQFTGGIIDGRADIFALGVVLYLLATGEYPFPGETMTTVSYKVVNTEPVPPRKLNPAVPSRLDQVILKCLAKSPGDRYQTGKELAGDLASVRAGSPNVTAGPTSLGDPQATLDPHSKPVARSLNSESQADIQQPLAPARAEQQPARGVNHVLLLIIAGLVFAFGGFFFLERRNGVTNVTTSAPQVNPVAVPSPIPPAAPAAAPSVAPTASATSVPPKPAEVVSSATSPSSPKPAAASRPVPPSSTSASTDSADTAARETGPLNFNPQTLNPNENAHLRVDVQRIAPSAELILVMDGKPFFRRTAAEFRQKDDDLYVPPGVHEFRVRARNGLLLKLSNIASADFESKKKKTLRIELRLPPTERPQSLTPAQIASDSSVFITLR